MCQLITASMRIERQPCLSAGCVLISWGDPQSIGKAMSISVTDWTRVERDALALFVTALSMLYGTVSVDALGWPHTN